MLEKTHEEYAYLENKYFYMNCKNRVEALPSYLGKRGASVHFFVSVYFLYLLL